LLKGRIFTNSITDVRYATSATRPTLALTRIPDDSSANLRSLATFQRLTFDRTKRLGTTAETHR